MAFLSVIPTHQTQSLQQQQQQSQARVQHSHTRQLLPAQTTSSSTTLEKVVATDMRVLAQHSSTSLPHSQHLTSPSSSLSSSSPSGFSSTHLTSPHLIIQAAQLATSSAQQLDHLPLLAASAFQPTHLTKSRKRVSREDDRSSLSSTASSSNDSLSELDRSSHNSTSHRPPKVARVSSTTATTRPTDSNLFVNFLADIHPQPYLTSDGFFASEPDPFGSETPSHLKFAQWSQLDEFIQTLSLRNGFRHVLRRSHKDANGAYRHGTYVCEFHASPAGPSSATPTRASSRSIRLSCPYKINFARQGENGPYHINKRVMHHSHVIDTGMNIGSLMAQAHALTHGLQVSSSGSLSVIQSSHLNGGKTIIPIVHHTSSGPVPVTLASAITPTLAPLSSPSINSSVRSLPPAASPSTNVSPTLLPQFSSNALPSQSADPTAAPMARDTMLKTLVHASLPTSPVTVCSSAPSTVSPEDNRPITEQSNRLSEGCDFRSTIELVRVMRECDSQIFNGHDAMASIYDSSSINSAVGLITALRSLDSHSSRTVSMKPPKIVLGGSGTSGRLSWLLAQYWSNRIELRTSGIEMRGLCAGGDAAIVGSTHILPDDDAILGRETLNQALTDSKAVVYIGVSCGLSSPYVAGQIDLCLEQTRNAKLNGAHSFLHTALLGFASPSHARTSPIDNWSSSSSQPVVGRSFRGVVHSLLTHADRLPSDCTVMTPILGPEFVTGATRLKGGSATFIILDAVMQAAFGETNHLRSTQSSVATGTLAIRQAYLTSLEQYERVFRSVYLHSERLASFIDAVAITLASPNPTFLDGHQISPAQCGRIFYLSFTPFLGVTSFIEAVDMNDSFGTGLGRVQAYFYGGVSGLLDYHPSIHPNHTNCNASLTYFAQHVLPTLTVNDTVLFILSHHTTNDLGMNMIRDDLDWNVDHSLKLLNQVQSAGATVLGVHIIGQHMEQSQIIDELKTAGKMEALLPNLLQLSLPHSSSSSSSYSSHLSLAMLAIKLILNIVSTGGHMKAGFLLQNRMINMRITSSKLYTRSIELIADLTSLSYQLSEHQLLRAIYHTDVLKDEIVNARIGTHVDRSSQLHGVLPLALLLAECESSRFLPQFCGVASLTHSMDPTVHGPAMRVEEARRRLELATFRELMEMKYSPHKRQHPVGGGISAASVVVAGGANNHTIMHTE